MKKKNPVPEKRLTQAEEQIMQIIWKLDKVFVKEILAEIPEPKPAYSTVSTIVRMLEEKGFVHHEAFGNTYRYYPLVKKEEYTRLWLNRFMSDYFGGSFASLASFFARDKNIDISDVEEILQDIDSKLKVK